MSAPDNVFGDSRSILSTPKEQFTADAEEARLTEWLRVLDILRPTIRDSFKSDIEMEGFLRGAELGFEFGFFRMLGWLSDWLENHQLPPRARPREMD